MTNETDRWYRIVRPNGTPIYGYGPHDEAERYARILDGDDPGGIDCHQACECSADEATELDERRDDGCNLAEVLAELEGGAS